MAKLVNVICLNGRVVDGQPDEKCELWVEDIDEAMKIAQHDLEAFIIAKNLVTTYAYVYTKIIDLEAITSLPVAIISYRPSFNYTDISGKRDIENFLRGI